jgi:hypothetical protein
MSDEVIRGEPQPLGIVAKTPKPVIASKAENASHASAPVTVIGLPSGFRAGIGGSTDCARKALRREQRVPLPLR